MVTSLRISEAEVTSTTVCGAATPRIVVRVTPSANSRATNSSANRASWSTPDRAGDHHIGHRVAPGAAAHVRVFGVVGQGADRRSTASSTSSAARAMSQPGSNSSVIRARPSVERAVLEVDPLDGQQRRFQHLHDAGVDVLGPGAVPARRETVTLSMTTSGKNCARIRGRVATPTAISTTSSRLARWRGG